VLATAEPLPKLSRVEDWQGPQRIRKTNQLRAAQGLAHVSGQAVGAAVQHVPIKSRKMLGAQGLYVEEYKPQPKALMVQHQQQQDTDAAAQQQQQQQQQGVNSTGIQQASVEQHKAEGCYLCYKGRN
jgi:hypothetical protein